MVRSRKAKARHPKKTRKIHRKPDPRIRVKPSPQIESRVSTEVAKATAIAGELTPVNLFASGYLVSAVYYHDGLFATFNPNQTDADPADRIVAHVAAAMPANAKRDYIGILCELCGEQYSELAPSRLISPVPHEPLERSRNVHPFAIDLFTPEGTPVVAAARGIVVLAESEWQALEWFSTSSVRGGNSVIIFHPDNSLFFRYAHLQSIAARAGAFVEAGDVIGRVGHTGFNADRKGHGNHLHFEINEYDDRTGLVAAISHDDLESLLDAAAITAACLNPLAVTKSG
jgi:murein DD-endopeptidase MepM/ murein hydrolase activator NlpD